MKATSRMTTAAMATIVGMGAAWAAEEVERPDYEVLKFGEDAELRRYAPVIVAQVRVQAESGGAAASAGFMPLANYIFGKNRPGEDIAMTAPVTTAPIEGGGELTGGNGEKIAMTAPVTTAPSEGGGSYIVTFTMPSKWTMETLPRPKNDAVTLRPVEARDVVASGFTGARNAAAIDAATDAVTAMMDAEGLTATGPFEVAGYSGPDVPTDQREWEVLRPVETVE